jgi:hypothetical protein
VVESTVASVPVRSTVTARREPPTSE